MTARPTLREIIEDNCLSEAALAREVLRLQAALKEVVAALFKRCGSVPPATMEERHILDRAYAALAESEREFPE